MLEKTISVELTDGVKSDVIFGRILRRERRELNKLVAPKTVQTGESIGSYPVEFEKWEEYKEKLISFSLRSPKDLKDIKKLQELPDETFNLMFQTAQEVNVEINSGTTEKKSAPPSSAE